MPPYGSSIFSVKIDTTISYGSCLMNGANQTADNVAPDDAGRVARATAIRSPLRGRAGNNP